jgi:hypothetical protein
MSAFDPKRRKAPISHASPAILQDELDRLTRDLDDARQREAATSEVLKSNQHLVRRAGASLQRYFGKCHTYL